MSDTFDLSNLDLTKAGNSGAWLTLRHPATDVELPIKLKLAGTDSDAYRQAERDYTNRRMRELNQRGKIGNITAESVEAQAVNILASATLDWQGVMVDGAEVPCTKEQAKKLYLRFAWIRRQAELFIDDPANFTAEGYANAIAGN